MIPYLLGLLLTPDDLPDFYALPELVFSAIDSGYHLRLERLARSRGEQVRAVTTWVLPRPDAHAARQGHANRTAPDGSPVSLPRSYRGVRAWVRPLPALEAIEYHVAFRQGRMLAELITESAWYLADGAAPPDVEETLRLTRLFARKLGRAQGQRLPRARFGPAAPRRARRRAPSGHDRPRGS